jgi:uncharacterized OB-fold protein
LRARWACFHPRRERTVPSTPTDPAVHDDPGAHYWGAVAESRLELQFCRCGHWLYPPSTTCPSCGFDLTNLPDLGFRPVGGRGVVYSYAVVDKTPPRPAGQEDPRVVVLVELDDAPGVRLFANLLEDPTADIAVGAPVEVVFQPYGDGMLPQFRRVGGLPTAQRSAE